MSQWAGPPAATATETSARAYSQAAYIADTLGDRPGVLTVQVGIANTYLAKGNLPQAQTILDGRNCAGTRPGTAEVQGLALHSRAALASRSGEHAEALKLAYEALNLTAKPADRDVVLEDIAAIFTQMGMHDPARDALLVLTATAQMKFVRWSATLNLMELASLDGVEDAFDGYARQLARAPLGPWLRSHYLLSWRRVNRFGRQEASVQALEDYSAFCRIKSNSPSGIQGTGCPHRSSFSASHPDEFHSASQHGARRHCDCRPGDFRTPQVGGDCRVD